MAEGSSSFTLPSFDENAEGWGPTQPPPQFADLPYAPFERKPFIGRMADWSAKAEMYRERNQHRRDRGPQVTNEAFEQEAEDNEGFDMVDRQKGCLLYTSPSPRDRQKSRMPSSA